MGRAGGSYACAVGPAATRSTSLMVSGDVAGKIVWTRSVLDTLAVTDKDTAPRLRGAHGYCASSCAFDQGA